MRIVLSPEAVEDLDQIFDYILEENPHMAAVVLQRIRDRIGALVDAPHLGRPGRVPGTRELIVPRTPFLVPYQVAGGVVEILRVYHGARQWPDEL